MDKIILNITCNLNHISPIITGLCILNKQGKIDLSINDLTNNTNNPAYGQPGVELSINGEKVYIDVSDGYNNMEFLKKNIEKYKFYFKRSYSKKINIKNKFKMIPYGLNYAVFCKNYKFDKLLSKKEKIKKTIYNILGKKYNNQLYINDIFSPKIECNNNPKICFATRLWNENDKRNININKTRIDVVRKLKEKYGKNFCGGIYDNELARKMCPDLIVSKAFSYKFNYLKMMKKCDICIATTGLHESIGWKFAEYIIASKAIVSEKLNYEVPGNLSAGKNYLEFKDADDCIKKVDYLVNNKKEIIKMMKNNNDYYNKYLKPDVQVMNMIEYVLNNSQIKE